MCGGRGGGIFIRNVKINSSGLTTKFSPGLLVRHRNAINFGCTVSNLNASMRYDAGAAPELGLDFHVSVTEVRVTSATSGLDGAAGIRSGSAGWPE